ncbi:MAG: TIGR04076 family protein [Candidatus Omnitrophota bacterium]|nr:TIGR04076 family protein [Candidatus Omnitrophota bacterium]
MKEALAAEDLTPQGLCIFAFHSIYPYYLTLINGGRFRWVRPKNGVIVQCPNPKDALEMKVFLSDTRDTVRVEVIGARGECLKGHKKGDIFILSPDTFKFCPKALDAFIPYLNLLAKGEKLPWTDKDCKPILKCPHSYCGNAEFLFEVI